MASVLAIVGRPNVGKSALFNRIIGRRVSIVHEEAGVTRDRVSAHAEWREKHFEVIDTGGIAFAEDVLGAATQQQAEVAIEMATALVLVVDVTAGITPLDLEIAGKLRASGKPIFLAVNKVDNEKRMPAVMEFAQLGFDKMFPIAAVHGLGVSALLDAATENFESGTAAEKERPIRVAIVGRPNVGKSSLVNSIFQSERTIVSDIPGTTRDSVDVPLTLDGKSYVLIDTAGLRHRSKIKTSVDQFGLMRAERSIRDCDVAVLVIDAVDGVLNQDKKIGGQIAEAGRGCVILVNKWDLAMELDVKTMRQKATGKRQKNFREEYVEALQKELFFLDWANVSFVSAKTGRGVHDMFKSIAVIEREMKRRIETPELNRMLTRALDSYPPPYVGGKRFKIFYAFQKPGLPPRFVLFVNDAGKLTPHYRRFLVDKFRAAWGFTGCPVHLELRERERRTFVANRPKSGNVLRKRVRK